MDYYRIDPYLKPQWRYPKGNLSFEGQHEVMPWFYASCLYEEAYAEGHNLPPERIRGVINPLYQSYISELATRVKVLLDKKKNAPRTYLYLITFTVDPKKGLSNAYVTLMVRRQLERKTILECQYNIEHKDTNFHIHARVIAKDPLSSSRMKNGELQSGSFDSFCKKIGNVDVSGKSNIDNGILMYITKENPHSRVYWEKYIGVDQVTWLVREALSDHSSDKQGNQLPESQISESPESPSEL